MLAKRRPGLTTRLQCQGGGFARFVAPTQIIENCGPNCLFPVLLDWQIVQVTKISKGRERFGIELSPTKPQDQLSEHEVCPIPRRRKHSLGFEGLPQGLDRLWDMVECLEALTLLEVDAGELRLLRALAKHCLQQAQRCPEQSSVASLLEVVGLDPQILRLARGTAAALQMRHEARLVCV